MAWTLKLDAATHDLKINSRGKFDLVSGHDEVVQRIKVALWHNRGEYFLAVESGLPYYDASVPVTGDDPFAGTVILGGDSDSVAINVILRNAIIGVPGVESLDSFEINYAPATRVYTVNAEVTTTTGGTAAVAGFELGV